MKKLTFLLCALVCASALSAQTYYIAGNSKTLFGASWDPAHMELDAQADGTYAKTFTTCVIDKEYQFKITNGGWDSETNGTRTWGFSELATVPEGVTGNKDNNIVCTTYDANMTVVFDPTAGKITLTGVFKDASGEGDPSEVVYSIKHGWKDGQDASWSYKDLTPNGDGTYFIRDIYGGTGCNWKKKHNSSEQWISDPTLVGSPSVGDSAVFTLTSTEGKGAITITKIGAAGGDEGGESGEGGEGNTTDYYLVGTINGADYGCKDDYANLGEYKFVGGKLTATFTEQSYVFVKTGDNNNWYMSETYVDAAESATATLKTAGETVGEKLGVPGNVEVHFTLTENGDGTLTLAYTTESTALQAVTVADIYANNGRIYGAESMRIYTVSGMDVTDQNGQLNGIYIVKAQAGVYKIVVK